MKKLKSEKNSGTIFSVFKKLFRGKNSLHIWQVRKGQRNDNRAIIKDFSEKEGTLTFTPLDPKKPFTFQESLPILFRENRLEVVFKVDMEQISSDAIKILLPKIIHFFYLKREPRVMIPLSERKEIIVRNAGNRLMKKLRLLDINSGGAGVKFHQNHFYLFREGDSVVIGQISDVLLVPPLKANIVYVKEITDEKNPFKMFRLGIKFETKLAPFQLAQILI